MSAVIKLPTPPVPWKLPPPSPQTVGSLARLAAANSNAKTQPVLFLLRFGPKAAARLIPGLGLALTAYELWELYQETMGRPRLNSAWVLEASCPGNGGSPKLYFKNTTLAPCPNTQSWPKSFGSGPFTMPALLPGDSKLIINGQTGETATHWQYKGELQYKRVSASTVPLPLVVPVPMPNPAIVPDVWPELVPWPLPPLWPMPDPNAVPRPRPQTAPDPAGAPAPAPSGSPAPFPFAISVNGATVGGTGSAPSRPPATGLNPVPSTGPAPSGSTAPEVRWVPPAPAAPPKGGERERKYQSSASKLSVAMFRLLDAVSEGAEVVDCLYQQLPPATQSRWDRKSRGFADRAGQYGIDGADWKLAAIWHNIHSIGGAQVAQFVECVAQNQIEDAALGRAHAARDALRPRNLGRSLKRGRKGLR